MASLAEGYTVTLAVWAIVLLEPDVMHGDWGIVPKTSSVLAGEVVTSEYVAFDKVPFVDVCF